MVVRIQLCALDPTELHTVHSAQTQTQAQLINCRAMNTYRAYTYHSFSPVMGRVRYECIFSTAWEKQFHTLRVYAQWFDQRRTHGPRARAPRNTHIIINATDERKYIDFSFCRILWHRILYKWTTTIHRATPTANKNKPFSLRFSSRDIFTFSLLAVADVLLLSSLFLLSMRVT